MCAHEHENFLIQRRNLAADHVAKFLRLAPLMRAIRINTSLQDLAISSTLSLDHEVLKDVTEAAAIDTRLDAPEHSGYRAEPARRQSGKAGGGPRGPIRPGALHQPFQLALL
jgi:hypothetical protein